MNNRFFAALVLLIVIICDVASIHKAWLVSGEYPFHRVVFENRLHFPTVVRRSSDVYNSVLTEINGMAVSGQSNLLDMVAERKVSSITYRVGTVERKRLISNDSFNNDFFAFFVFLLLCGNIHCALAVFVRIFFENHIASRYFSRFAAGVGYYLIALTLYLLYPSLWFIPLSAVALLSSSMLQVGVLFVPFLSRRISSPMLAALPVFLFVPFLALHLIVSPAALQFADGILALSCFVLFFIFCIIRLSSHRTIPTVSLAALFASAFCSVIFPFTMISFSFIYPLFIPLSFFASMTIFLPMIVVVNIAAGNLRNLFIFKRRHLVRLLLDLAVSLFFSVAILLSFKIKTGREIFILCEVLAVSAFVILLRIRKGVVSKLQLYKKKFREPFTLTLRQISELTAAPVDLQIKTGKIFDILEEITGVDSVKLELFENALIRKIGSIDGRISYSSNNALYRFLQDTPHILYKHSLFLGTFFDLYVDKNDSSTECIIPIREEGTIIGVFKTSGKSGGVTLAGEDIRFLSSVSILLYHLIENEILFLEYTEKRKYEKEIDIASYIQMRLFPRVMLEGKGFSLGYFSRPYIKVTGDYFDFIPIDEDRTLIAIGDVAGHGLSAATILAVTGHIITVCLDEKLKLENIFNELNDFFTLRYRGTEIMTLFLMVYDRRTRVGEYINAGHCCPVLLRSGDVDRDFFPERSLIIGASSEAVYARSRVQFRKGDDVVLYTDGIVEIQSDQSGNNIGDVFLIDVITRPTAESVIDKVGRLGKFLEQFPKNSIRDDITVLGIHIE